jgi:peptide/nickel transport system substrate-binding protein
MTRGIDRRGFIAGTAGATAIAALAGCTGGSPAASRPARRLRYGGDLRIGLTGGSSADTLDPNQNVAYPDTARAVSGYDSLVELDRNGQLRYSLAREITARDTKGTQWVIRLRPGITFHDGQPLTAQDVIYSMRRVITSKFTAGLVLGPVDPKGLKALDPLTVLVPMTRPYATFPEQLASILTGQIVPQGFTAQSKPNGTGPFKYVSFTPGQQSVFARNPGYWRHGLPYADSLTIIDFRDTASLSAALQTGQIHAAGTLDAPSFVTLKGRAGITAVSSAAGTIVPFTMRVDQAPFTDVRVRQAMRLLVDRPQLVDSALDGYGTTAHDVFSPYDPAYDKALHRQQDIPQAKFLLKRAGQENLKLQLTTAGIDTGAVAMATVLAEQAAAAGVTIALNLVSPGVLFGPNYLQWTMAQDFYSYAPYIGQATLSMLPGSPWNETHQDDAEYNSLYAQANAEPDPARREPMIREMQMIDFDRGGYIIPAFVDTLDAYGPGIGGYGPSRGGRPLNGLDFTTIGFLS